jgi:hypothetical protein
MRTLLIETEVNGHYVNLYLKKIINEFLLRKTSLALMTTRLVAYNENNKFLLNDRIKIYYIEDVKKPKKNNLISQFIYQIKYYYNIKKNFKKISKDKSFDHIYVNTLDHFDKALSLFGSPFKKNNFYGFYNHIRFHLNEMRLSKKFFLFYIYKSLFIKFLNIRNLKKIFILDSSIKKYLKTKNIPTNKLITVNEAVDISRMSLQKKEINIFKKKYFLEEKDFIILVYGSIRKEKGIDYLVNCLLTNFFSKKIKIIIAGKCEKEILININNYKKKLKKYNFEIILFNFLVNDKLQKIIFTIADLVWVGYDKYYASSGVYYLAGFMKKPVIINNRGSIYDLNKKYKIGLAVDITNSKQVYKKISFIMTNRLKYYNNNFVKFIALKQGIFEKQIVDKIV